MAFASIVRRPHLAAELIGQVLRETKGTQKGTQFPEFKARVQARKTAGNRMMRALAGHASSDWNSISESGVYFFPFGSTVCILRPGGRLASDFPNFLAEREGAHRRSPRVYGAEEGSNPRFRLLAETVHFAMMFQPTGVYRQLQQRFPMIDLYTKIGGLAVLKTAGFVSGATAAVELNVGLQEGFTVGDAFDTIGGGAGSMVGPNRDARQTGAPGRAPGAARQAGGLSSVDTSARHSVLHAHFTELPPELKRLSPTIGYVYQLTPAVLVRMHGGVVQIRVHAESTAGVHHNDDARARDTVVQGWCRSPAQIADLAWGWRGNGRAVRH